jgi:4-hydroxybenzoate polyprenyltransferase
VTEAATAPTRAAKATWRELIRLARPHQWLKTAFVLVGPFYYLQDNPLEGEPLRELVWRTLLAAVAFSLASSGCYVFNDLADAASDRSHPRKCLRPIACGAVSPASARMFGLALFAVSGVLVALVPWPASGWVGLLLALHIGNVLVYSAGLKHIVIVDVISLAMGFVIRVMAGCAAVGIGPSTWLLNVTFFLSMFLAFGKRLGERRALGSAEGAAAFRAVQGDYSDEMLRMVVVVTGVATLVTYAGFVQDRSDAYHLGFNLLWLTMLPATYGLIRCITLLENGRYDDPTELAVHDSAFRIAAGVFVAMSLALVGLKAFSDTFVEGIGSSLTIGSM